MPTMTLDEAIDHCREEAESGDCKECREEHLQLAIWLLDYKRLLIKEAGQDGRV